MQKLAPSISSEDWNTISQLKTTPKSAVLLVLQGLRTMEQHFGFEGEYSSNVANSRKSLRRATIAFSFLFAFTSIFQAIAMSEIDSAMIIFGLIMSGLFLIVAFGVVKAWKRTFRRIADYEEFDSKHFEQSLKRFCEQMNINYYSTGLEAHKEKGDTMIGWGIGGISVAVVHNLFSSAGAAKRNKLYNIASLIFSYTQIADHFNQTYYSEEYNALPQQINLS
jgi:hypothetical protein